MNRATVDQLETVELPQHVNGRGVLVVAEGERQVPFAIARVFSVNAEQGTERGRHAHKRCAQFLIAVSGTIDVHCDDGSVRRTFKLASGNVGLLVPPFIWISEHFRVPGSVLLVLCDRLYEEDDYIRDYDAFLAARGSGEGRG
jgi:hypothetical protein